jgi:hypothetical protein
VLPSCQRVDEFVLDNDGVRVAAGSSAFLSITGNVYEPGSVQGLFGSTPPLRGTSVNLFVCLAASV